MQKKYFEIKTNYDKFDLTAKGLEKIINQNFNQSIVKVKEIKIAANVNPISIHTH